ncbi:hypothetical protein [Beutenbergia cavernae]|nr:hypothetical protein [Beutenbergia cavernae]
MPPPSAAPRASSAPKAPSNRALFRLGATQMVLTIVVVIVLNVVARRLGLNFWGSVALCAVVALAWPFVAARFRRR